MKANVCEVSNFYFNFDKINSVSKIFLHDEEATVYIDGIKINWKVYYSHYKEDCRLFMILNDRDIRAYIDLFKEFTGYVGDDKYIIIWRGV